MKILILGGYGVFGGRLAELLADIADIELLICGRSLAKAEDFGARYRGKPRLRPLQLDRADILAVLEMERPDLVVDASGPFQNYGKEPYSVVEACIASGVDYVDFADAADFVFGVSRFDSRASVAGVSVLSGVSSFPVLTAAVLREMAADVEIVSVRGGIAPSPYAGIGMNVMRAVVGYAGAPVKLLRNGVHAQASGLTESLRYTICPPGRLPLGNIRFSLVDVPDLQVIPPEHASMQDIWMGAGPLPELLHRMLNLLAKARATFGLPSLTPLAGLFYRVLNLARFGEHRGGMFIHATGLKDGKPIERSWHLLAEGDDGPYIPSMAIESIIRKRLAGIHQEPGAGPATRALKLADYDTLFAGRTIHAAFRDEAQREDPIYKQVLSSRFDTLPPLVKALHGIDGPRRWVGHADVVRGRSWAARAICKVLSFPVNATRIPVQVDFSPQGGKETWKRTFGRQTFVSVQSPGKGRNVHLMMERFGPITVALALVIEEDRLHFVPRRWQLLGVPMPPSMLPGGRSFETERNGQFVFDIEIKVPLIGPIVAYSGELHPIF